MIENLDLMTVLPIALSLVLVAVIATVFYKTGNIKLTFTLVIMFFSSAVYLMSPQGENAREVIVSSVKAIIESDTRYDGTNNKPGQALKEFQDTQKYPGIF